MASNLVLFQILRGKEGNGLFIRSPKTNSVIAVNLYSSCTLLLEESQVLRMEESQVLRMVEKNSGFFPVRQGLNKWMEMY